MAQPDPYTRLTRFTGTEAGKSTATLGVNLDKEFDEARLTIEQTRGNLGLIQRDDGLLANQSVHAEALSDTVLALLDQGAFRMNGSWSVAKVFSVGDIFEYSGVLYLALTAHTANDFSADLALKKFIGPIFDPSATSSLQAATGLTIAQAVARVNDPRGVIAQLQIVGRGIYVKDTVAPTSDEATYGWAFTDAGGTIWRKPMTRRVVASEWGVTSHTQFDGSGNPIGTPDDNAPILNALFAAMEANKGGVCSFEGLTGACYLASSVYVPYGISMDGIVTNFRLSKGFRFRSRADGIFYASSGITVQVQYNGNCEGGILFWLNVHWSNPNTWVTAFPQNSGTISNICIDGSATGGIKGFRYGGTYEFARLYHHVVSTLIEKIGVYADATVIRDVTGYLRSDDTSRYLINIAFLGDGVRIETIASAYNAAGDASNGVFLGDCQGGKVSGLINGNHMFLSSRAITLDTFHLEDGQITVDGADVTIRDGFCVNGNQGKPPIVIQHTTTAGDLNHRRVSIDNVNFIHPMNRLGSTTGWASTSVLDVDLKSSRVSLVMGAGNRRTTYVTGQTSFSQLHAPMVGRSDDVTGLFTDSNRILFNWKNYAHIFAGQPITIVNMKAELTGSVSGRVASWAGIITLPYTPAVGVTGVTYKGPTAAGGNTYFARALSDPVRLIGRAPLTNTTAVSAALVSGQTTLPGFRLNDTSIGVRGWTMLEVYRDTGSTGVYDKRVIVPTDSTDWFIDDGNALNSFAWEAYGPSAAPITLNNSALTSRMQYLDGVVRVVDSTFGPPTVGTWQAGDLIELPANAPDGAGGKLDGTRCRTAGTPGTWDNRYTVTSSLSGSKTFDPPSVAAQSAGVPGTTSTTVTVTGVVLGDPVVASFSLSLGGLRLAAEVTSADTVTVTFINQTASPIDLGSGTLKVRKLL